MTSKLPQNIKFSIIFVKNEVLMFSLDKMKNFHGRQAKIQLQKLSSAEKWVDRVIMDAAGRSLKAKLWPQNERFMIRKLVKSWPLFWRSWARWRNLMNVIVKFRWKWRCILSSFYDLVTCGVTRFFRKLWLSWFIRAQNATKNGQKWRSYDFFELDEKYLLSPNKHWALKILLGWQ